MTDKNQRIEAAIAATRSIALPDIVKDTVLAEHLGLPLQVVRSLFQSGEIPGKMMAGQWFGSRLAILAALVPEQPLPSLRVRKET